jgi:hypothetical protein
MPSPGRLWIAGAVSLQSTVVRYVVPDPKASAIVAETESW